MSVGRWSSSRDLNPGRYEYEAGVLITLPQRSVVVVVMMMTTTTIIIIITIIFPQNSLDCMLLIPSKSEFSPLKPSGNYTYHRLLQSVTLHFMYMDLVRFLQVSVNSVNQLIFVMVKCGVLFEVRTEFLNNI
jgi:hypothetical protein